MRKIYLLSATLIAMATQAQVINFPDANFKAKLLQASEYNNIAEFTIIDANANGEIEQNEAAMVFSLNVNNSNISDLTGIAFFCQPHQPECHWQPIDFCRCKQQQKTLESRIGRQPNHLVRFRHLNLINQQTGFKLGLHDNPLEHLYLDDSSLCPHTTLVLKNPGEDMEMPGIFSELICHQPDVTHIEIPWQATHFVEIFEASNLYSVNIKNGFPTVSLLKAQDFEFSDAFAIYPNPAKDGLNIESKNAFTTCWGN